MRKLLLGLVATGSLVFAGNAYALCANPAGVVGGAAAGAATGGVLGGPVGAVAGGAVGAAVGAQALPPDACTYVVEQEVPVTTIEGEIVVGEPLPETVILHEIPETRTYVFAHVNEHRVIVDPDTRVVVEVVN